MTDGKISASSSDWMTSCPKFSPAVTGGLVITGTAYVTGNGGAPPFGNSSALTLCILGADNVKYANFTMAFDSKSKAATHFGSQPIHGVVLRCAGPWEHQSKDCSVENTED
jgi:hypothetical protein